MSAPLPSPEFYDDWRDWARAVSIAIQSGASSDGLEAVQTQVDTVTNPTPGTAFPPTGWNPVWWDVDTGRLWLGNPDYDPPTAPDIVFIDTQALADAAVTLQQLADSAVAHQKILDAAVDALKLADAAITNAKLQTAVVSSIKLQDLSVITAKLNDLVVDAAKLANLAVTGGKLVDGAVGSVKLALLAVQSAYINDLAVIQAKIGLLAVGAAQIVDAAVGSAKIADAAIINAKIGSAAILSANIGNLAVLNAHLGDATVTTLKVFDAAILSAKIGNAAILTALIGDLQVVTAKMLDLSVNNAKIANLAVDSGKIANLAIGNAHIQDASIYTAKIADLQITSAKIANTLQSTDWNPTTKAGWQIDKSGIISGQGLRIYDTSGTLIFGSGGLTQPLGGENLMYNGSFEDGLHNISHYSDGGAVSEQLMDDTVLVSTPPPAAIGHKYWRISASGGHNWTWDKEPIVARSTTMMLSFYMKDSGIHGPYNAGGVGGSQALTVGLMQAGQLVGQWAGNYSPAVDPLNPIVPAAQSVPLGAGWTRKSILITGLTIGQTYYLKFSLDFWAAGQNWTDIDGVQIEHGSNLSDYRESTRLIAWSRINPLSTGRPEDYATLGATYGLNAYGFGLLASLAQLNNSNQIGTGIVTSTHLLNGTITGSDIGDGQVGQVQLADGSIIGVKISNGTLTANLLADGSIVYGSSKLSGFGVLASLSSLAYGSGLLTGFGSLAAVSVLTSGNISTYIAGAAIGGALIANAAIGSALIVDAAVLTAKIGDLQVITAKLNDLSVITAKLNDLAVTAAKIASASITSAMIQDAAIGSAHIQDLSVTHLKIGDQEITTPKLVDYAVSNSAYMQLASGGSLGSFPLGTFVDFTTAVGGGSGGGGGGGGGGGPLP